MRINSEITKKFLELQEKLPNIIEAYEISVLSLSKACKMSRPTFYKKMKNKAFTAKEMLSITDFINK